MESPAPRDIGSYAARWLLAGMIAGFLVLLLASLKDKTVSYDETAHLVAGWSYWRTGDFRLNAEHPPLVKLWAGLWVMALNPRFDSGPAWDAADQWFLGRQFLFAWNRAEPLLWTARLAMASLNASLGLVAYAIARRRFGSRRAGLVAAALILFEPNILGHAGLVTFDVPLALFLLGAGEMALRVMERLTARRVAALGLLASAATLTKAAALPALAWLAALSAAFALAGDVRRHARRLRAVLLGSLAVLLIVWAGVWAGYGFRWSERTSASNYQWTWNDMNVGSHPRIRRALAWAQERRLFPEAFFSPFGAVFQTGDRPAWMWGRVRPVGSSFYFVSTLAAKTPEGLILLLGMGVASLALSRRRGTLLQRGRQGRRTRAAAFFLLYGLGLLLLASLSRFNIGHRHVLMALPFLILAAACAWERAWSREGSRLRKALLVATLAWALAPAAAGFPHYVSYFNIFGEAWRASHKGEAPLLDSNADWGQDLPLLARRLGRRGVKEIQLAYFGTAEPERFGIQWQPLLCDMEFQPAIPANAFSPSRIAVVSSALLPYVRTMYPALERMTLAERLGGLEVFVPPGVDWSLPAGEEGLARDKGRPGAPER